MIGVDTNVLVRFLVEDDPAQASRVHRLLARARQRGEPVFISLVVLCETAWVLRSAFRKSRSEILAAVENLLSADVFRIEEEDCARAAVDQCRASAMDVADSLIGQINLQKGCRVTVTFDRSLRNQKGFSPL